ncbi:hypothetical protein Poly51_03820 [Rubripirellula tenax]|uniref:Putative restriction endonuclease domain-containing protein n=1 Tax=Rubripirellula tenax TaxID=2528015 RepID=A0A5C6FFB6_9BACT|nr:Uma2 family endonuclease [Rubripirellula tenax]TWU60108.1 hypothetical protein Poly51_03820 [Rubripirellula tenax]
MQLIINLPSREETVAFARDCWGRAIADARLSGVEGKFETNSFGQLIVNPPPTFFHNDRAFRIAALIEKLLGGAGRTDVPLETLDGIKVPDAAWFSDERYQLARGRVTIQTAPEICVEVISPSNTEAEMQHKRNLYFEAGAQECWTCDEDGRMSYYEKSLPNDPKPTSTLCPNFPNTITD